MSYAPFRAQKMKILNNRPMGRQGMWLREKRVARGGYTY